jgi:hypothetical protein
VLVLHMVKWRATWRCSSMAEQRAHKPPLAFPIRTQNATFVKRIAAPTARPRFTTSDLFPPQPTSSGLLVNIW